MLSKKRLKQSGYVGFWLRVLATLIDSILWYLANFISYRIIISYNMHFVQGIIFSVAIYSVINALYEIIMTYKFGGTAGKLLLGMKVVDEDGKNISIGQSIGRYFSKMVSDFILCIGYLIIAWDKKKQGLHDMMASTYVINAEDKWQKRRKYVLITVICLFVIYCAYFMFLGLIDGVAVAEYSFHKIDQ